MTVRRWTILLGLAAAGSCAAACGGGKSDGTHIGGNDAVQGAGGAANNGAGGTLFTSSGGALSTAGAAGISTPMKPCGGQAFRAEPAPVDMYIMFDKSSSMSGIIPNTNPASSWWQAAQQAVTSFVNDPRAAGMVPGQGTPAMTVGLQFFPLGGIAPESCQANYEMPDVELGLLPCNASALSSLIAS